MTRHLSRELAVRLLPVYAVCLAMAVAAVVLLAAGIDPGDALTEMVDSSIGGRLALGNTVSQAAPLLLTALAVTFCFRAGIYSVGAEGQLYVGALAGTWAAIYVHGLPGPLLIVLCFALSALGGAAWAALPALARAYRGTNEIMSTLLLNFIAINLVAFFVARRYGPMHGSGVTFAGSDYIQQDAHLPTLISGSQANSAILIGVAIAIAMAVILSRTSLGFQIRSSGFNPIAARYAGHSDRAVVLVTMIGSGAVAGLAGTSVILSQSFLLGADLSPPPGWGYVGIVVALLGGLRPLPVIGAALFFGALSAGAQGMQLTTETPASIALIIEATTIIFLMIGSVARAHLSRRAELNAVRTAGTGQLGGPGVPEVSAERAIPPGAR